MVKIEFYLTAIPHETSISFLFSSYTASLLSVYYSHPTPCRFKAGIDLRLIWAINIIFISYLVNISCVLSSRLLHICQKYSKEYVTCNLP